MATFRAAACSALGLLLATLLPLGMRNHAWGETPSQPGAATGTESQKSVKSEKSAKELRTSVRSALKDAAVAKDKSQDEAARTLVALYGELKQNTTLNATERASLTSAVRYRLARISKQVQERIAKEAERTARASRSVAAKKPARGEQPNELVQVPVAAQQFPIPPQNPFQAAQQAQFQQQMQFGPLGARPVVKDYGDDLVKLIENTIAPDTWSVHGGEGTIHYFRPSFALIVNNTAPNHDQLGGLLGQLRK